ncbi:unnamed protein product [Moneuplotes crassus]|uniref:Uncharacterized protein n=1 Tax=Euplotes crassus TaxID=5936 RepID=A0AAD1XBG4_EUPCR|nr:unnamed protein product [Moneuplotes crassus]
MGNNACCANRQPQQKVTVEKPTNSESPRSLKKTRKPQKLPEDFTTYLSEAKFSATVKPKRKVLVTPKSKTLKTSKSKQSLHGRKRAKKSKKFQTMSFISGKQTEKSNKNASGKTLLTDNIAAEIQKMYAEKRARRVSCVQGIEYKPTAYCDTPITKAETIAEYRERISGLNFDNFSKYNKRKSGLRFTFARK